MRRKTKKTTKKTSLDGAERLFRKMEVMFDKENSCTYDVFMSSFFLITAVYSMEPVNRTGMRKALISLVQDLQAGKYDK